MGNDQSKSDEERRQRSRQQQGVSRDEVNRLLEQQKREYDRKLQELNVRKAQTINAVNPIKVAREAREVNDRNIDHIIAQQLQDFVQIAYNNNNTPPSKAQDATSTQRSPIKIPTPATRVRLPGPSGEGTSTATPSIERNRNPYNFSKEDLQNRQSAISPQTNLYPNLQENTNFVTFPATDTPLQQKGFNSHVHQDAGEFVIVNRNKTSQGNQPSAPPPPTGAISKNSNTSKQSQFRSKAPKNEEETLNCKTCGNKFGLNIFQCSNGHSSCRDCKLKHVPCGVCRAPIGDTRNLDVEKYISEVKLAALVAEAERKAPCMNSDDGCSLILKNVDMDAHLKECPHREFICPLAAIFGQRELCKWRGKLSHIVSHFDEVHPAHRQANIDTEMVLINILDNNHVVHLIDLAPFVFLVHLKVADQDRKIYMTVQLLGTQISASKWTYELHIYNKREPRRKFQHTDICHSDVVRLEEIFSEFKCAAIPQSYAMSFINEGVLNYKFFIKREIDAVPSISRGKWRGGGRGRGRGRGAKTNL